MFRLIDAKAFDAFGALTLRLAAELTRGGVIAIVAAARKLLITLNAIARTGQPFSA